MPMNDAQWNWNNLFLCCALRRRTQHNRIENKFPEMAARNRFEYARTNFCINSIVPFFFFRFFFPHPNSIVSMKIDAICFCFFLFFFFFHFSFGTISIMFVWNEWMRYHGVRQLRCQNTLSINLHSLIVKLSIYSDIWIWCCAYSAAQYCCCSSIKSELIIPRDYESTMHLVRPNERKAEHWKSNENLRMRNKNNILSGT